SGLYRIGREPHVEVIVDRLHQLVELVGEEVVRAGDQVVVDGDVPLRPKLVDQFLDRAWSNDLVRLALDDDSGRRAGREEAEIVHVGRRRDRDEAANLGPAHQQL